jgi:hypothetical protein
MASARLSTLHGPPAATLRRLLDDSDEHDFPSPRRVLDGLTANQAGTVPPGLLYSIARLVAHMLSRYSFWNELD